MCAEGAPEGTVSCRIAKPPNVPLTHPLWFILFHCPVHGIFALATLLMLWNYALVSLISYPFVMLILSD